MDLYDAIEVVEQMLWMIGPNEPPVAFVNDEQLLAIKILLEAARDKAGV